MCVFSGITYINLWLKFCILSDKQHADTSDICKAAKNIRAYKEYYK